MHLLLELALGPGLIGDLLDPGPSLIAPPSTHSPLPLSVPLNSPFLAGIVIWCELDLLLIKSELGAHILPLFLPLTGSLALGS